MRRCETCFWFKNKWDHYFNPRTNVYDRVSCFQLGSNPSDPDCGDWQSRNKYFSPELSDVHKIQERLNLTKDDFVVDKDCFQKAFTELISETFSMEQDFHSSIKKIKDSIEDQGYNIPFDEKLLEKMFGKVMEIRVLQQLVLLCGLGFYQDEIVGQQIKVLFPEKDALPKSIKKMFPL